MSRPREPAPTSAKVRCAIYTRKSSEEGLEQEFNSLHAQRESAEAYIKSQSHEGWVCLPDTYDDGGFTGGNIERPAVKRLLADIEAGRIDCVVVYKVDRLSRSLMDFARMMEVFEKHKVSFVSVTQQFNTVHSMGRLTLNILLSFAQFEREIISERTRDKIAAARRKGKWAGGHPLLGYDIDPRGFRLLVNEDEAPRVRAIFELYLEHRSLVATVIEIDKRGWTNKRWTTRKGKEAGGKKFNKTMLFKLLTNVAYTGMVRHKKDVYPGEHAAIVDAQIFERVQKQLRSNGWSGGTGGAAVRNRYGALLKGLIRCVPCRCMMGHTYTAKAGKTRYRYYVCLSAQKRGWHTCPSKAIPAGEIERLVVERIRALGRDPALVASTVRQARKQAEEETERLGVEKAAHERELRRHNAEVRKLALDAASPGSSARLGDLNERIRIGEQRMTQIRERVLALSREMVDEVEASRALAAFDPVWESLSPREQGRIVTLLVREVAYDGVSGSVSIRFHPGALGQLAAEPGVGAKKEVAA
ncbi:MAG: recombinase family protein [Phycisphaerae bacterium]|nr:recombinase family protein [Phycisphaerae bacterium]